VVTPFAILLYKSEVYMAIYHCNVSNVSRGKGSSACATLSYITGEKIKDERLDLTFDYGRKERVLITNTITPTNAPSEYKNASVLFNAIEQHEKSANARTAKKIEVALPREFDLKKQKAVVENFINKNIASRGYACAYAIHADKDNNNPHAHILVANRQIDGKGEWSSKRKMMYALDEQGQRIPQIDKKTGLQKTDKNGRKQWKRVNAEVNPLDQKETLRELRECWAVECNKHLAEHQQIDHRSLAEQSKEQIATIHEGYGARALERRGGVSERCEYNREVARINQERKAVEQAIADNRAFTEVLIEIDSRLQDLWNVRTETPEGERRYNSVYSAVVDTIERRKRVPTLQVDEMQGCFVSTEDTPQKALSILQATRDKWSNFINGLRESVRNAPTDVLEQSDDKNTAEPRKSRISLLERVRGAFEDMQRKRTEKQELERQRTEEWEREWKEQEATIEKLNAPYYRHDYQQVLDKLEFVAKVYAENGDKSILRQKAFEKLGEMGVVQTKRYSQESQFWFDMEACDVPTTDVYAAIRKTRANIKAKIEEGKRPSVATKFEESREQIEVQRTMQRQSAQKKERKKSRGHEDR
jgi:hypothetical protein